MLDDSYKADDKYAAFRYEWREKLMRANWWLRHGSDHDDIWVQGFRQLDLFWPFISPAASEEWRGRLKHPPDYDPFVEQEVPFVVRFCFRSHGPEQLAEVKVFEDPENSYPLHLIIEGGKN